MRDKYGVIDLGLDESQDYLISPEFPNAKEAIRRLKSTFNEHHRPPQGLCGGPLFALCHWRRPQEHRSNAGAG